MERSISKSKMSQTGSWGLMGELKFPRQCGRKNPQTACVIGAGANVIELGSQARVTD